MTALCLFNRHRFFFQKKNAMRPIVEDMPEQTDKNEELVLLLDHIESIKEQEIVSRFKIVDIKKKGFLIIIKGLYAYVPFHRMPWTYPNSNCWETITFSLKKRIFFGKVFCLDRHPDHPELYRMYIDATVTKLREATLSVNEKYTGIVIQKTVYGAFVDIGHHFDWKCGSLPGLLHLSQFSSPEEHSLCDAGQTMEVKYWGKTEKGLQFGRDDSPDLQTKYAGKNIQVKNCINEEGIRSFLVDDLYRASMPVTKTIYGENKKLIRKTMNSWVDGQIIDCEVLRIDTRFDIIVVKWTPNEAFFEEFELQSQALKAYVGKIVPAKICRKESDNDLTFLIEDQFRAVLSTKRNLYVSKRNIVKNAMTQWQDGEIIDCEIINVNVLSKQFIIKWLIPDDKDEKSCISTCLPQCPPQSEDFQ